jgi:predicted permease
VLLMTTLFYNSGNFALPLQDLAFQGSAQSAQAMSLQVFVMLVQNFTGFTLGVILAASGQPNRHWKQNLLYIVRFPPIYALAAALVTVQIRTLLGPDLAGVVAGAIRPFWNGLTFARDAFMAIALVSLGSQMALLRPAANRYPVTLSVILRLLVAPAMAIGLIWLLGLNGLVAQVLIIGAGTPTAVNSMLLCLQFDNHPDYAARAVFYSTLLSPLTVTCGIFLAQQALPGWLW